MIPIFSLESHLSCEDLILVISILCNVSFLAMHCFIFTKLIMNLVDRMGFEWGSDVIGEKVYVIGPLKIC